MKKVYSKISGIFSIVAWNTIKINDPVNEAIGSTRVHTGNQLVNFILSTIFNLGVAVVFFFIAYGGFVYLTGAGNQEQTTKAKKIFLDTAIGFILLVASYALALWVYSIVS